VLIIIIILGGGKCGVTMWNNCVRERERQINREGGKRYHFVENTDITKTKMNKD
jgi:hypothetical protein